MNKRDLRASNREIQRQREEYRIIVDNLNNIPVVVPDPNILIPNPIVENIESANSSDSVQDISQLVDYLSATDNSVMSENGDLINERAEDNSQDNEHKNLNMNSGRNYPPPNHIQEILNGLDNDRAAMLSDWIEQTMNRTREACINEQYNLNRNGNVVGPSLGQNRNAGGTGPPLGQSAPVNENIFNAPQKRQQLPYVINAPNPNLRIPQYNAKLVTADHYLDDIETYFRAQHHTEDRWVNLVTTILSKENKQWYDINKEGIRTWDQFRRAFNRKFDSPTVQKERITILHTRRKQANEPVETFVYDMVSLSKQVYPNEEMEISMMRVIDGLVPDLRLAIDTKEYDSPESLIEAAKKALKNLEDKEKYKSGLPPLTKSEAEARTRDERKNESKESNEFRSNNSGYRFNGGYRENSYSTENNPTSNQNENSQTSSRVSTRGHPVNNSNNNYTNYNYSGRGNNSNNHGYNENNSQSHSNYNSNVECAKCTG